MKQVKPFKMSEIAPDDVSQGARGWELRIDGKTMDAVSGATLEHPTMGIQVEYGKRPEGYDGFVIREPGGAATIPYMIDDNGRIYVGVVTEYRPTMGEEATDNIPRGFADFKVDGTKETALETAEREVAEETGYRALGGRAVILAEGLNPNSTFFDYSRDTKEGVTLVALPVMQDELELMHDNYGNVMYSFPGTIKSAAQYDKAADRILGSKFIPLQEALKSRDMFTSAAAGQLLANLLEQGEYLVPQTSKNITPEPIR